MKLTRLVTLTRALGTLLGCIPLCTSCASSATGPRGLDPTVLVTNDSGALAVSLTWFDQSGQKSTFTVPQGGKQCVHFTSTQIADSVRFIAAIGAPSTDTLPGTPGTSWAKQWSPWFNPATGLPTASAGQFPFGAENWTLQTSAPYTVQMMAVNGPPC